MQTKTLAEASFFTAIFVVMALMAFYLPLVSVIMVLVMALPHSILAYRHGVRVGLMSAFVSVILLILLMDIITALMIGILYATVGIAIGFGARHYTAGKSILLGTVVGAICFAGLILLVLQVADINLYTDLIDMYREALTTAVESGQLTDQINIESLEQQLTLLATTLMPSMILIFGFMTSYIGYRILQLIGNRLKLDIPPMPALFQWRFPKWVGVMYVAGNTFMLLAGAGTLLNKIGLNISLIFTWPVLLQGVSLVVIFMGRYIRSKLFFIFLLIIIFTNPLLSHIISLLGLFDMFFDYRGWVKEKGENK